MTWLAVRSSTCCCGWTGFSRRALTRDRRVASSWFGGCVALSLSSFIAWLVYGHEALLLGAVLPMGVAMPIVTLFSCDPGWPRQAMSLFAAAMALVGVVCLYGVSQEQEWGYNTARSSSRLVRFPLGGQRPRHRNGPPLAAAGQRPTGAEKKI